MNEYLALALSVFIVYRFALMIATEDGPFEMFKWWREFTLLAWGPDSWITRGFYCPLCIGFWISFMPPTFFADSFWQGIAYALAIAGAQTFLTLIGGIPE